MASSFVFYKFKSQREPSRIAFDGTAISVFDLKKEIIAENRMGKGADFDFAIYHADTEEEYKNDRELIPRSTSVIARRLPPARGPGRGNALDYMVATDESGSGSNAMAGRGAAPTPRGGVGGFNKDMYTKRFDGREDVAPSAAPQGPADVQVPVAASGDEASAMAAMFAATSSQWQQTQEQMSHAQYIPRPGQGGRPPPQQHHGGGGGGGGGGPGGPGGRPNFRDMPRREPPPGYICYRCGQKGHWIQDCPKNSDPAYDNRPRIKRTTGIPKSFLTEVAGPLPGADEDETAPGGAVKGGVMVTAEGGFVVARPDSASWLAHRAITANLSAHDIQNLAPTDPDLTCPVCSKLLRDATLTPCCNTSFCDECVTNALLDNDMLCPECETRVKSLEKLKPDEDRRERCKKYVDDTLEASKEAAEQEKQAREAEEERLRSAEEKRKKAEADAAAVKKEEGVDGEDKEATPAAQVEDVKKEDEELFPERAPEILNPRQPRPGEDRPPSTEMTKSGSNASPAPSAPAGSPARTASATPAPPSLPAAPAAHVNAGIPPGMSAAQQAAVMRQQQIRAQQQQQMLAMQQQMIAANGGAGMPSLPMLQQNAFRLSAMLQNPALPPPMRMQLQAQLQQCQMMMMQLQNFNLMQQRMAMSMAQAGVGVRPGMAAPGMQPMVAQQQGGAAAVNGAGAAAAAAAAGQKRGREEDSAEGSPAAKKSEAA
ncbi:Protein mpe1 [Rhodotorula kratochvilovae]